MGDCKPCRQDVQETSKAPSAEAAEATPCRDDQGNWYPPADADPLDEASMDSFPCSDPPSHMSRPATPSTRPAQAADPAQ